MKLRTILVPVATAILAGAIGWFAARTFPRHDTSHADPAPSTERKILFYQSAMHPWIRSDKPGKCTICGMDLTPVFEGQGGIQLDPGLVSLGSNAISVLHVQSRPVARGPLHRTLHVAGTLNEDDTRHHILSAWVAGRIDQLHVNFVGTEVQAGQPLARFYSPMLLEAERQFVALHAAPGSTTTHADHDLLRDSAAQRLRQLGLTTAQIESLPSKSPTNLHTEILAPAGGTVVERFVYPGQYVMEGERLFEIADFSTLWFIFDAYEQDLPWLALGQEIEVTTPSAPGLVFRAPIQFINPDIAEATRSAKIRVEIPNPLLTNSPTPRRTLLNRAYAEGRVHLSISDALLVPRSAVLSPADRPVAYVDRGSGIYEQRPLRLGRVGDAHYEVLSGLEPGDNVVVQGNLMIDAQAQLNQTINAGAEHVSTDSLPPAEAQPIGSPPHPTPTPTRGTAPVPSAFEALLPEQAAALHTFLNSADALRTALANDDLPAFHRASSAIPASLQPLHNIFPNPSGWRPLLDAFPDTRSMGEAPTLRDARKAYHPFSAQLVALAKRLRVPPSAFPDLKIYRCPMTAESFDGAPSRTEWLQIAPPMRNPWFGAEMLDCGVEVRE